MTKRYTEEAVRYIERNAGQPFFLYVAHSLPHIPLARSAEFVDHSAGGMHGDVIEEIDWSVGEIVDALRGAGVERDTLVLFTSDNGPWLPVRTPAIFSWPGTLRPLRGTGPSPRTELFYYWDNEPRAVLFDLAEDPGERFDAPGL